MNDSTYRKYMLVLLMLIFAFNNVDRLALGLLLQDIKVDLNLSDTQLGFMSGIAFALFYALMGIPIARWADRGNRVTIITVTTALWSAAVSICGLIGSFGQLLAVRCGVAIGEAGCHPPAHSLIADYYDRDERPQAIARYMLGMPLSFVIGYFVAGWLNEGFGWRLTFVFLGLPGLGLALLAWLTLREPRRASNTPLIARSSAIKFGLQAPERLTEVVVQLWSIPSFRHLLLCFAVASFFGNGIAQWKPAFFARSHGMGSGELGTWFALIYGLGGVIGMYCGGELAARYAARNERLQLRALSLLYCVFTILSAGVYMTSNKYAALSLLALSTFGSMAAYAPLFATIQTLVPDRMRATSIALIYLSANLIGLGFGPLVVGALSDFFREWAGQESLRYALLALCPGYCWGGLHLWLASRSVRQDIERTISSHKADQAIQPVYA